MASRFLSSKFAAMTPYHPGEQPHDRPYIKLNTNENPYPPAPGVVKAVSDAAGSLNYYNDPLYKELRHTLAAYHGLLPEQVFVANGADEVLMYAFDCFFDAKQTISLPDISYEYYKCYLKTFGIPYRELPLDDDFSLDIHDYFDCPGALLLTNPNAPTGLALSIDEIEQILRRNPERLLILDEAYVDFSTCTALPLLASYNNLLIVRTFSKSRNMAGARIGYALAASELIQDMDDLKSVLNPYIMDSLAQRSGLVSLDDEDYFRTCCQRIIAARDQFAQDLRSLGMHVLESATNFVFAESEFISGDELYAELKRRGVLVRHYKHRRINNFVRISIGTDDEMKRVAVIIREILVTKQVQPSQRS